MTAIELNDAVVTADENDPNRFTYAPRTPGIAPDSNDRPQLNVLTAGGVAFLQVTGAWGLSSGEVTRLKERLAARLGRDPAALTLAPASDAVENVTLLIADAEGRWQVLQQGKSSGVPPFHAVFNVMLNEEQLEKVQAALDGQRGLVALRYHVRRRRPVTQETGVEVRVKEAREGKEGTRSWSVALDDAAAVTARETAGEVERLAAELDAADWKPAR